MSVRWAALLTLICLLTACANHPSRKTPAATAASGTTGIERPPTGVVDNIQLPQSRRYAQSHDSSPDEPEDVRNLREPVPKVEPRSRYGNAPTYTVRGHVYHVLASAKGYDERGIASWYGSKFHGHLTSSLEPYDMYKFTAASKTLPLPTYARVTNLDNGKSVIVRVNDRGPFHANRLIDLSYAAAVRLGIWRQGTGLVDVQAIDPGDPQELPPAPAVLPAADKARLFLQIGAFADQDNADRVAARLRALSIDDVHVSAATVAGRVLQLVRVGPLHDVAQADRLSDKIQHSGLPRPQAVVP